MFELIVGITVILIILYMPYLLLKMIYEAYLIKTGKSKRQIEKAKRWDEFDEEHRRRNIVRKIRKERREERETAEMKRQLSRAERLIQRNKFEEAIEIFANYESNELVKSTLEKQAYVREEALDYNSAILIWEELGDIKEAARVRKKLAAQGSINVAQKVVHGDEVTKTEIKDSVVSKSNIGSGGDDKIAKIKELKELHDSGHIDDDEFKQMKKEILGK